MGKIIQFPQEKVRLSAAKNLKNVSDQLDSVILGALHQGMDAHEISGILAHRLGSLMKNIDQKSELWDVCQKVLKKQAGII